MSFRFLNFAIRSFKRQKLYTAITVIGLSLALGSSLLILSYVNYELSFEKCHDKADRIYRIGGTWQQDDFIIYLKAVMYPLGPEMKEVLSEVEEQVRFCQLKNVIVKTDHGCELKGSKFLLADPEIFEVFTIPLIQGSAQTALSQPLSVVISRKISKNLFGESDPLGKTITIRDSILLTVTGVMSDIPLNTQIHTDFLASFATLKTLGADLDSWGNAHSRDAYTYILLVEGANPDKVDEKLPGLLAVPLGENANNYTLHLQPLRDIYFHSTLGDDLGPTGSLTDIYLLIGISLLIMFMACFNYVNLSTARIFHRYLEIFVRTAVGANRRQLLVQFLAESVLLVGISMVLGLAIYEISIPYLEAYIGQSLDIGLKNNVFIWLAAPILVFSVGVLAGSYPAVVLSRLGSKGFIRNHPPSVSGKSKLRRAIIVIQAGIAICLIGFTVGIQRQLDLAGTMDLGFNPDNIRLFEFDRGATQAQKEILKREYQGLGLTEATLAASAPGESVFRGMCVHLKGEDKSNIIFLNTFTGDADFCSTFSLRLKSGRWLSDETAVDIPGAVLINETTAELLGLEDPIGAELISTGKESYTVIGVVEDFLALSLHSKVMPSIITGSLKSGELLAVRLPEDGQGIMMQKMQDTWKEIFPDSPFESRLLNDVMADCYSKEQKLMSLFSVSSGLSIFIACLGLFGLVTFMVERRIKEIGIRKCIGATVISIVSLITSEFILLIMIAGVIAWPVTKYAVNRWLENFIYRIEYGWFTFVLVVLAILILFLSTVSIQVIKAATTNPVDVLRCE
ncbi:MAG: ABC transporter permease [candidate division Zixibacteria bacterium]|nr:ABC transporter permease [candidate division Zixibacteria bacterium]